VIAALASFGVLAEIPQCGSDEKWWKAMHVHPAFLPGVVSLIPLAWMFSSSLPARQAGGIAGFMRRAICFAPSVGSLLCRCCRSGRSDRQSFVQRIHVLATLAGA